MRKNDTFSIKDVEILDNEPLYEGFLSVVRMTVRYRLFEGGWSQPVTREVMRRKPGIGVLLYDPDLDKVVLVEQFRIGCLDSPGGPWVLELVAGIEDTDEGFEEIARREAMEEAGVKIGKLLPVAEYYNSPGGSSERLTVFCAAVDASRIDGIHGLDEEHEDIRPVVMDRLDAMAAIESGRINNAMSIITLQWLALNLAEVRHEFKQQGEKNVKNNQES